MHMPTVRNVRCSNGKTKLQRKWPQTVCSSRTIVSFSAANCDFKRNVANDVLLSQNGVMTFLNSIVIPGDYVGIYFYSTQVSALRITFRLFQFETMNVFKSIAKWIIIANVCFIFLRFFFPFRDIISIFMRKLFDDFPCFVWNIRFCE